MKKYFIILAMIFFIVFLTGCQSVPETSTVHRTEAPGIVDKDPLPNQEISVRSSEQLDHMREMLSCPDEEELNNYLMTVEGGGAQSKEDLVHFLALVDSIPYIEIMTGEIGWISYSNGKTQDTEKEYEILYVTRQAENGDWIRFEYMLSVKDVPGEVAKQREELSVSSLISAPMVSVDGKTTFYEETREAHVSGTGDVIRWIASIDGIYANIVYYTSDADPVDTAEVLSGAKLSHIVSR